MSDIDKQEKLVLWAYVILWSSVVLPPIMLLALIYLLVIRNRIINPDLRSHVSWLLATCTVTCVMVPVAFLFLFVGLSGVNTDSPISIFATFALVAGTTLFPLWLLYRFILGSIRFSREQPMLRLFP